MIQVAPRSKQVYEEKELMECDLQIVEFVSPNNQGSTSTHNTEVAMLVDNQIDHEDDQNHDQAGSHTELEEDDDLDLPYEPSEARISKNQSDWHLLNDDEFLGELDILINIFVQQDLQADD